MSTVMQTKGNNAMIGTKLRRLLAGLSICILAVYAGLVGLTGSPTLTVVPAQAQSGGQVPGGWSGSTSDAEFWRAIRKGVRGKVSIPDQKAAQLVQSEGDEFRAFRNGKMASTGIDALIIVILLLFVLYIFRGKIKIDAGPDAEGRTIERFNVLERFTHWLTASSFIVLALTGLNVLYGKLFMPALIGKEAFATLSLWGKLAHNYIAWAFIIGIVMMFVLWVKDNIPGPTDIKWLAKGGGLFSPGVHPPSKRFNAGQKMIFWAVVLGGGSLSMSGLALLFPFEIQMFAGTFKFINAFGFDFPTVLSPLQETQYALMWHGIVALGMIAIIIGHIYIGSVGMEGAIDAVADGQVDRNWAKEHHGLWVEELDNEAPAEAGHQPAE